MKQFPVLLALLAILGLGLTSCSKDEGPAGPSLTEPTNLTAAGLSDRAIQLTWTFATGLELGFKIHRASAGEDNWAEIAQPPANAHLYINSDLTEGAAYRYRIKAYSRSTESGWSNLAAGTTWPKAPAALQAARVDGHTISLNWADSSNTEEGFEIQRKRRNAQDYLSIDTISANVTTFTDFNLSSGVTFTYRVRAVRGETASAWSPTGSATTTIYVPPAPIGLQGEALSSYSVLLSWTIDHIFNETGYVVEYTPTPEGVWAVDSIPQADQRQRTLSGLTATTMYYFRIYAYNDSGPSDKTPSISVETQSGPPAPPINPAAVAPDFRTVVFTWTDNSTDETSFIVERKLLADTRWTRLGTTAANIESFEDAGVRPLTRYFYHVCSANDYGQSPWTAQVEVTVPDGPPNNPSRATATARGLDRILLTWGDNSQNEDGFMIERMMTGVGDFSLITAVARNVTAFSDTGLTMDTEYNYRVKAFNANYESGYSNVATARTWSYVVHWDDFESYDVGNPPGAPWQVTLGGSSTVTVVSEDHHE
ncbi:MAG: fibronectin type III domain-containing protein, partial [Calditrichota bacterium]